VAWVYLALHGTYGLCWLLKDVAFPDPNFQRKVTFGSAFNTFALVLGPYWVAPFLIVSGTFGAGGPVSDAYLAGVIALHTFGVALMLSSDAQKYFALREKKGLIEDGLFKHVRHPNYLGEMMIYSSYALLAQHWIPWAILAWVWIELFMVNMLMKEASLSRYPGWAAYKARSGMLLPWPGALFRRSASSERSARPA
jgi:protein-S-isoprenylcysteine O-methyltransferase Ste14